MFITSRWVAATTGPGRSSPVPPLVVVRFVVEMPAVSPIIDNIACEVLTSSLKGGLFGDAERVRSARLCLNVFYDVWHGLVVVCRKIKFLAGDAGRSAAFGIGVFVLLRCCAIDNDGDPQARKPAD